MTRFDPRSPAVRFARLQSIGAWFVLLAVLWQIAGCSSGTAPAPAPAPIKKPVVVKRDPPPPRPTAPEEDPLQDPAAAQYLPPPFDVKQATERIVVYVPEGPLLVDLTLAIDGAPYRQAREALLDRMMQASDTNHDGQLEWSEALGNPHFTLGDFSQLRNRSPQQRREEIMRYDLNGNGRVEREEAEIFVAQAGDSGTAFSLDAQALDQGRDPRRFGLWRLLDEDRDAVLSAGERASAEAKLSALDTDDDELLRYDEAIPTAANAGGAMRGNVYAPFAAARISPEANWPAILYALDERYLYDGRLQAESFPLDPQLVPRLDADQNGYLDRREVQALAEIEPHLVIAANFGESEQRPRGLTVVSTSSGLANKLRSQRPIPGGVALKLSGVEIRFTMSDTAAPPAGDAQAAELIKRLDTDKNGYLEKSEAQRGETGLAEAFDALDTDADGKLYAEEIADVLRWRQAPAQSRLRLMAQGESLSLFSSIDANDDRVLSPRERREAPERLAALDANGDSLVALSEAPAGFAVTVTRGAGGLTPGSPAAGGSRPKWFTAMDSNRDGDVTRREFLGAQAQFDALDRNHDGFIDAAEAAPQ